jgi:hypothetical protein
LIFEENKRKKKRKCCIVGERVERKYIEDFLRGRD